MCARILTATLAVMTSSSDLIEGSRYEIKK